MKWMLRHFPWIATLAGAFLLLRARTDIQNGDPDRFFHLALARETVKAGRWFLESIPQVEGLGWNDLFHEKEFLFHLLGTLGFHLGGESGVIALGTLVSILVFISLYLIASRVVAPFQAFFSTAASFCAPVLLFRLFMLRPHTLGVLTFVIVQGGLILQNRWLLAGGAMLFALAYHAFYIPLACLLISMAARYWVEPRKWRESAQFHLWGIAGIAAGILLNPHFPTNLILGIKIAGITSMVQNPTAWLHFGEELYPLPSHVFILRFLYPVLIFLVGIVFWMRSRPKCDEHYSAHLYSVLALGFFLALCTQSPRAGEYAIPMASLSLALTLRERLWGSGLGRSVSGVLLVVAGWILWNTHKEEIRTFDEQNIRSHLAAAAALPAGSIRVFNCEWDRTPYLYWARPEAAFLDLLDPSLFHSRDPQRSDLRELFKRGYVPDPRRMIAEAFKADYVYCYWPLAVQQLQKDPGFRQIYPKVSSDLSTKFNVTHIFEVIKSPPPQFVRRWRWERWLNVPVDQYQNITSLNAKKSSSQETKLESTHYLNLGSLSLEREGEKFARCASVHIPEDQLRPGATLLGLGGGRNLRAWRNGRPLFASRSAYEKTGAVQVLIPIPAVKRGDHFEIVACSSSAAPFWGVVASLWTRRELDEICEKKSADRDLRTPHWNREWGFSASPQETCLGPLAVPLQQ